MVGAGVVLLAVLAFSFTGGYCYACVRWHDQLGAYERAVTKAVAEGQLDPSTAVVMCNDLAKAAGRADPIMGHALRER